MSGVLCFGNLQLDVLCRPVTALPAPGGLQQIDALDFALSGNGGNLAAALGKLGVPVALAGYSGADLIGEGFRTTLSELGVDTACLLRHPSAGTGTSVIALAPNGERSVLFVNGANAEFDLDEAPDAWLEGRRVVSVSSIFVLPQFSGDAVGRLFARARARGAQTVLNICWDGKGQGLAYVRAALAEADYFALSMDEGRQLTGHRVPERILETLQQETAGCVILTRGADGCCLIDGGSVRYVPELPVQAVDVTGAGDSFLAGFIAGLMHGRPPVECARLGCAVASFAITGPGAYPRIPPLHEVQRLLVDAPLSVP